MVVVVVRKGGGCGVVALVVVEESIHTVPQHTRRSRSVLNGPCFERYLRGSAVRGADSVLLARVPLTQRFMSSNPAKTQKLTWVFGTHFMVLLPVQLEIFVSDMISINKKCVCVCVCVCVHISWSCCPSIGNICL